MISNIIKGSGPRRASGVLLNQTSFLQAEASPMGLNLQARRYSVASFSSAVESFNSNRSKPTNVVRQMSFTGQPRPLLQMTEPADFEINEHLKHGKVVMWTLGDNCSVTGAATRKAKQMLEDSFIEYEEHIVSDMPTGMQTQVRLELTMQTGYGQFPNIYFGTEHVGGYDDLVSYFKCQKTHARVMDQNGILPSTASDVTDPEEEVADIRTAAPRKTSTKSFPGADALAGMTAGQGLVRERLFSM